MSDGDKSREDLVKELNALRVRLHTLEQAEEERRQATEEQLLNAAQMEAVGRLAGGIAHEFNNLLTVILGYSDLLLEGLPPADPSRESIEEIKLAGQRAASLTRQLLAFGRKQVLLLQIVDFNAVVGNLQDMLAQVVGEEIDVQTQLDPDLAKVRVDPGQMGQVLLNLAANARDAMPGGGRLVIKTANVVVQLPPSSPALGPPPGQYVLIAVKDTGPGMDEATRAHVFEPFFTTKSVGQGSGLSLAMVYGLVKQSGGHVSVKSAPGQGTAFQIYLPRVDETATAAAPAAVPAAPRQQATILLVEDEQAVRALARRALEAHGYRVLEAADGAAALRLADLVSGPIDLLLTDIVMPHVDGREVADHLTAKIPRLPVVFMSAYAPGVADHPVALAAGAHFIPKPFTAEKLVQKVREALPRRQ